MSAAVINPPDGYHASLLSGSPEVAWGGLRDGLDLVHVFSPFRIELGHTLGVSVAVMRRDGMIWASWPKKSSGRPTDISEDTIRELCLPMGLVDVKVCAVDDVWSGLKLVIRKENR